LLKASSNTMIGIQIHAQEILKYQGRAPSKVILFSRLLTVIRSLIVIDLLGLLQHEFGAHVILSSGKPCGLCSLK